MILQRACVCSAYHSLARAISVLGDAESAVNILQVRATLALHSLVACTLTVPRVGTAGDEDATIRWKHVQQVRSMCSSIGAH